MDRSPASRSSAVLTIQSHARSREELLRLVPGTPDESWQKGDRYKGERSSKRYVHSGAEFRSRVGRSAPAEEHVDDLLARVAPATEALRGLAEQAAREDPEIIAVQLRVIVETNRGEVGLALANRQLRTIADLGAEFLGVEVAFVQGPLED
jgi:hypothetical protein